MSDLIDRRKTIEHIKKRLVETALNNIGFNEDVYLDIADHRIETWVNSIPPAQPEQKTFSSMTNIEFEKWLYDHGICHPDVYEFIPCRLVPMLIDNAINELPSAQPEPKTPIYYGDGYADGQMVYDMAECPKCGYTYDEGVGVWGEPFCPHCGQALDWSVEEQNE